MRNVIYPKANLPNDFSTKIDPIPNNPSASSPVDFFVTVDPAPLECEPENFSDAPSHQKLLQTEIFQL